MFDKMFCLNKQDKVLISVKCGKYLLWYVIIYCVHFIKEKLITSVTYENHKWKKNLLHISLIERVDIKVSRCKGEWLLLNKVTIQCTHKKMIEPKTWRRNKKQSNRFIILHSNTKDKKIPSQMAIYYLNKHF